MQKQQGFTLIELLVVIAIIGILATLVITQLGGATTKAWNSTVQSDVVEAGKGVSVYMNDDAANGSVIGTKGAAVSVSGPTAGQALSLVFAGTNVFTPTGSLTYSPLIAKTPSTAYTYKYTAGSTGDTSTNMLTSAPIVAGTPGVTYQICGNTAAVTGGAVAGFVGQNNNGRYVPSSC